MRKKRDNQFMKQFMVYFMAFLMVGSLFGVIFFGFGSSSLEQEYRDYEFKYIVDHWETEIDNRVALFTYFPTDVAYIDIPQDASQRLRSTIQFDVTSDLNDTNSESIALAQFQMITTLANFDLFMRSGFTEENEFNQPIITCNESTEFVPVIYFKSSNESKVYLQDDCIVAEAANPNEVIRVKDRIVYDILGIIE